jgi:DNA-binding PadR family transcriptional regulator
MPLDHTDLENVILGVVLKRGPCTAYMVRMEFERSPSSHFSSSPGSIYPIVRRLEARGWLRSEAGRRGKQRRRLYSLTTAGRRALRGWLTPPLPDSAIGMTLDPLRTRVYFLAALPRRQRAAFFEHATKRLEQQIASARVDLRRYQETGDTLSGLAAEGGIEELRTRLRWIRRVATAIASDDRS